MSFYNFTVVPNDGFTFPAELLKDGAVFAISSGADVQAALISGDHTARLAGPVDVLQSADGSDWVNSLVVCAFTAADLAELTFNANNVVLEIQVQDPGQDPQTWFFQDGCIRVGYIE